MDEEIDTELAHEAMKMEPLGDQRYIRTKATFIGQLRRAERIPLAADVAVRRTGVKPFRVRIYDLSPKGCKVEFVEVPAVGERVWVKFDCLESLEATVRWTEGHTGGVQFERSLYEPVFRRLCG
jgi:hypothetical protein